jgi:hypothetical protein
MGNASACRTFLQTTQFCIASIVVPPPQKSRAVFTRAFFGQTKQSRLSECDR